MTIPINVNSKILLSGAAIAAAAALIIGATFAFFSDTETSVNNTIQAGSIDLKVDSISHYNEAICIANPVPELAPPFIWSGGEGWPIPGTACDGTWTETDLGATHKFFNLTDVKPGDDGEDTISLHVYNNDAWGRFLINNVEDLDNDCTEPETEVGPVLDPECDIPTPGQPNPSGELANSITFYAWLDQGVTPGFQNIGANGEPTNDPDEGEGDNIWDCGNLTDPNDFVIPESLDGCDEPLVILPGTVDNDGSDPGPDETHNIWQGLALVDAFYCQNGPTINANGHNNYGECQGIADDGRMVGSTTYYFGLAWSIPTTVGNEAQTDSLDADLIFQVVQHRNNPGQSF